jgi:PAS domain S-box-containing protein
MLRLHRFKGFEMSDSASRANDQRAAELAVEGFKNQLGPFVVAAEETRMAMAFTGSKRSAHAIIFANKSFLSLTGYDLDDVLGQSFYDLIEQGCSSKSSAAEVRAAFDANSNVNVEICYHRKDGEKIWVELFITPVRDSEGDVVQHFVSLFDLTEHKEDQAVSRMLIDELNHRVKNTLVTVRSIVSHTLNRRRTIEESRAAVDARLFALSRSHDLLSRENWRHAGLLDLVNEALSPFDETGEPPERLVITGDNTQLPPNTALALGIGLHELATNAVKYGALSSEGGSVVISWATESSSVGDRLRLQWRERHGPLVRSPGYQGFGSRVIERGLAHELSAKTHMAYHEDGLVCTIDMPAPVSALDR